MKTLKDYGWSCDFALGVLALVGWLLFKVVRFSYRKVRRGA